MWREKEWATDAKNVRRKISNFEIEKMGKEQRKKMRKKEKRSHLYYCPGFTTRAYRKIFKNFHMILFSLF